MAAVIGGRVLVTGGAGTVGSAIVDRLLDEDVNEILVLDNFSRGRRANLEHAIAAANVSVIDGDIRDRTLVTSAMAGVDVVFHQAALRITQCASEPRLAMEVLVDGTFNVLEAAVNAGVRRVVAASSASVYGLAAQFPTAESHPPYANRTIYGAAKQFNEGLLRSFHESYGLDYVALRYFNVYGPRMDAWGAYTEVLIRWMGLVEAGRAPVIYGDGRQTMDLVYVDDVAHANVLAAASDVTDEVLNVGTGAEVSLLELAHAVIQAMGSDVEPEHAPERSVNPVPRRVADCSRAQAQLGFAAEVGLEEGLARLVEWWLAQPDRHATTAPA